MNEITSSYSEEEGYPHNHKVSFITGLLKGFYKHRVFKEDCKKG